MHWFIRLFRREQDEQQLAAELQFVLMEMPRVTPHRIFVAAYS
jgi:hypothetical protein